MIHKKSVDPTLVLVSPASPKGDATLIFFFRNKPKEEVDAMLFANPKPAIQVCDDSGHLADAQLEATIRGDKRHGLVLKCTVAEATRVATAIRTLNAGQTN